MKFYDRSRRFWFRYFDRYQEYIEINNTKKLTEIIPLNYPTYSGIVLEYYFKERMKESQEFKNIGSWWEG